MPKMHSDLYCTSKVHESKLYNQMWRGKNTLFILYFFNFLLTRKIVYKPNMMMMIIIKLRVIIIHI